MQGGAGGGSYLLEATQLGGDRAGVEISFMPGPVRGLIEASWPVSCVWAWQIQHAGL